VEGDEAIDSDDEVEEDVDGANKKPPDAAETVDDNDDDADSAGAEANENENPDLAGVVVVVVVVLLEPN
jgi:hypothetical protein